MKPGPSPIGALVIVFAWTGCALLGSERPDPGTAAREAYAASQAACQAYELAVQAGAPRDERAEKACAALARVCAD